MSFAAPPAEARKPFTKAQQNQILLRQGVKGADDVYRAFCAECECEIALLGPDGLWKKLRPFDFDHIRERAMGGETTTENGQALCSGPNTCHAAKTASGATVLAKANAQGGRTGQYARRMARKAKGQPPLLRGKGFGEKA